MKYKDYNDFELISYIKEQNEEANEIIYEKYKPLIVNLAKKMIGYKNIGLELNDLVSEGMLGLYYAIDTFDEIHNINFSCYAKKCIESKMINIIRMTKSLKHKCLNDSISYDNTNDDFNIEDIVSSNFNIEDKIVLNEDINELMLKIKDELTTLEYKVFKLKMDGLDNINIADILKKTEKDISNTISRIKNKIKKINKTLT